MHWYGAGTRQVAEQQKDMGHRGETIRVQDSGRPNQNPLAETENALSDKNALLPRITPPFQELRLESLEVKNFSPFEVAGIIIYIYNMSKLYIMKRLIVSSGLRLRRSARPLRRRRT